MARKQKVVVIVPDVAPFEKLDYDQRLPDPQIVFGGMQQVIPKLTVSGRNDQATLRPIFHAVFLVPEHLMKNEQATQIGRAVAVPDVDNPSA